MVLVSKVFCESPELSQRSARVFRVHPIVETMLNVIVDQLALRVTDSAFDGVELLRKIKTGALVPKHGKNSV
jgi:hypothetical protein